MTNDLDREPVRWGLLLLGLVLGAGSLWGGLLFTLQILSGTIHMRAASALVLILLLMLVSLIWILIFGVRLVLYGVRGQKQVPRPVYRAASFALLTAGLIGVCLLLLLLSRPRPRGFEWWHLILVVSATMVSFLLVVVMQRLAGGQRGPGLCRGSRGLLLASVPLLLVLALVLMLVTPRMHVVPRAHRRAHQIACMNSARNLAILLSERSIKHGWPPYGGKNFVLSLVAYELIDIRNPENLETFFCPGSGEEGARPPREAYELVTLEALSQRRFPELTVFAGRRNDEPSCRLGDAAPRAQEAVLACAYEDGVVVGFADGSTRWCEREDLGFGPDDPIVFGEASASPLLRKLSDL